MFTWIVRALLVLAGVIASWFIGKDAPGFASVQMTIATLLFVAVVAVAAFWPLPYKRRHAGKPR
jgi:hypothetical protein